MSDNKRRIPLKAQESELDPNLQMELFQSSGTLNLSDANEFIPKGVSPNDPNIEWADENLAYPIDKKFRFGNVVYDLIIHPASVKEEGSKKSKSHFCWTLEEKVEKAIIKIASSEALYMDKDNSGEKIFAIETTYYQIRKEIADAMSETSDKTVNPKNVCSIKQLKKSLDILTHSRYEIVGYEHPNEKAVLSRIKGYYRRGDRLHIELGNLIAQSISSGNWRTVDSSGILSSNSYYDIRLRTLLNTRFTYASKNGKPFSPGMDYLLEYLSLHPSKLVRTTIMRLQKLIIALPEVEKVDVEKVMEGRKIVNAIFHIYPSQDFIKQIIQNNVRTRSISNAVQTKDNTLLIEPGREQFTSEGEYQKALHKYNIDKDKHDYIENKNNLNK